MPSRGSARGTLTPVDRVFGELGIERRIEVMLAGWLALPFVLEGTDLVAIVPERLARIHTGASSALVQVEPPFGRVLLAEGYWFERDRLTDPAHAWLFARLDEVGRPWPRGIRSYSKSSRQRSSKAGAGPS